MSSFHKVVKLECILYRVKENRTIKKMFQPQNFTTCSYRSILWPSIFNILKAYAFLWIFHESNHIMHQSEIMANGKMKIMAFR